MNKQVKIVTPTEAGVLRRFFQAIDMLVSLNRISALESFCKEAGLSAPRYRETRLTYGVTPTPGRESRYKSIETRALCFLCTEYNVSGDWILTSKGKILRNEKNG